MERVTSQEVGDERVQMRTEGEGWSALGEGVGQHCALQAQREALLQEVMAEDVPHLLDWWLLFPLRK